MTQRGCYDAEWRPVFIVIIDKETINASEFWCTTPVRFFHAKHIDLFPRLGFLLHIYRQNYTKMWSHLCRRFYSQPSADLKSTVNTN